MAAVLLATAAPAARGAVIRFATPLSATPSSSFPNLEARLGTASTTRLPPRTCRPTRHQRLPTRTTSPRTSPSAGRSCCARFFTGRLRWIALTLLFWPGRLRVRAYRVAVELVGGRISSLAAVLFRHLAPRLSSRRASRDGPSRRHRPPTAAALFNNSSTTCCASSAWRRCSARRAEQGVRGPIRSSLTERGLQIAGGTLSSAPAARPRASSARASTPRHQPTCTTGGRDLRRRRPRRFARHLGFFLLLVSRVARVAARPDRSRATSRPARGWRCSADHRVGRAEHLRQFAPMWILMGSRGRGVPLKACGRERALAEAPGPRAGAPGGRDGRPAPAEPTGRRGRRVKSSSSRTYPSRAWSATCSGTSTAGAARSWRGGALSSRPTPWAPRCSGATSASAARREAPGGVRDGITAEYPRFVQPPKRLLFEPPGHIAYRSVSSLPSVTAGRWTGSTRTRRCRTAPSRSAWPRSARALRRDGARRDVYQHFARAAPSQARKAVLGRRRPVMANSSAVADCSPAWSRRRISLGAQGTTAWARRSSPGTSTCPATAGFTAAT